MPVKQGSSIADMRHYALFHIFLIYCKCLTNSHQPLFIPRHLVGGGWVGLYLFNSKGHGLVLRMLSLVHIMQLLVLIMQSLSVLCLVGVGVDIYLYRWPSDNYFSGSGSL